MFDRMATAIGSPIAVAVSRQTAAEWLSEKWLSDELHTRIGSLGRRPGRGVVVFAGLAVRRQHGPAEAPGDAADSQVMTRNECVVMGSMDLPSLGGARARAKPWP